MVAPAMERQVEAFVEQPHLAVLSTVSPSGDPQATAIWYAFEAGAFYFNVHRDSVKARNIRRNAAVALTIDERDWPYKQAVISGRAEEVEFDEEQARRVAVAYLGEEAGEIMHANMMAMDRVRFRLIPQRTYWQDFGARALRPANRTPEGRS